MKNYAPENAAFKMPFGFDPLLLKRDLEKCNQFDFLKNYVPANYDGDDYILPLRAVNGRIDLPAASPNKTDQFADTPALAKCEYFKQVIDSFKCDKEAVRLMNLPAGRVVNEHTDYNCGYEDGLFRVHIPILTNDEVYFLLNKERIIMQPGEAWYTNVNLPHSVANKGKTNRIHLVLDGIRNDWSDAIFKSIGYNFDLEYNITPALSESTLKRMIEELESQDSHISHEVIDQFKEQLRLLQEQQTE